MTFLRNHNGILIGYQADRCNYDPDVFAVRILEERLPQWVSFRLKNQIVESLRGLSKQMALNIVGKVIYFINYGYCGFTKIEYIDRLLKHHFNALLNEADRLGIEIRFSENEYNDNLPW